MTLDSSAAIHTFGPSRPLTLLIAGAAILAGGDAIATSDPAGRLLLACVAIALATIAASDVIFTPRLSASPFGLAIRSPALRTRLAWRDVDLIRVDEHSHWGLSSRALEIEAGETLVVIGKRGLGCDPRDVFATLSTCARLALGDAAAQLLAEPPLEDDRAPDDEYEQDGGNPAQAG